MGRKKAEEEPPDAEQEQEDEEYSVEVVLAARPATPVEETSSKKRKKSKPKKPKKDMPQGQWKYLVKWYNYDEDSNSWEPEEGLAGCKRLLRSFWENVGMDDNDYAYGTILYPEAAWIEKEKKHFAKEQEKELKKKAGKGNKEKKKEKKGKGKEVVTSLKVKQGSEVRSTPSTSTHKTRRIVQSDSDSELSPLDSEESDDSTTNPEDLEQKRKRRKTDSAPVASSSTQNATVRLSDIEGTANRKRKRSQEVESQGPPQKQPITTFSPSSLFSDDEEEPADSHSNDVAPAPAPAHTAVPPLPQNGASRPPALPVRPAASTSTSIVGPPLPTRPPKAQAAPAANTEAGSSSTSGLSTKQRLGQRALDPTPANRRKTVSDAKPSGGRASPVRTGSKTVMPTNFRRTGGIAPSAQPHLEPTLASLNATPGSPAGSPITDLPPTHSPITLDPPTDSFDSGASYNPNAEANDFLWSIMPPELAGPLEPAAGAPVLGRHPPPAISLSKGPALPSRPPMAPFLWRGELLLTSMKKDASSDAKEHVTPFKVIIEDDTNAAPPALRFSIVLKHLTELNIERLYNVHDLASIIPACKKPVSFGRMRLQSTELEEKKPWTVLLRFLSKSEKIALYPLRLDSNVVGHLMLATPKGCRAASISPPAKVTEAIKTKHETLIACILPWRLTQAQIESDHRKAIMSGPLADSSNQLASLKDPLPAQLLESNPQFQDAIRNLQYPDSIWNALVNSNRYWWVHSPSGESNNLLEVQQLKAILRLNMAAKGGKEATRPELATVVFIHVGAVPNLQKIPYLRGWLSKTGEVHCRMYTFGTHPSVHKQYWGCKEIFACGGVATFAPSAFMKYPSEIRGMLKSIKTHPFWTAYILPSVLGMVINLAHIDETNYDKSAFAYLFRAIENGDIALIEAPPENKHICGPPTNDSRQRWIHDYLSPCPPSAHEAISISRSAYASVVANRDPRTRDAHIEREIEEDLLRMQRQPVIMANYRRFVVIGGTQVSRKEDALEWLKPDTFRFGDSWNGTDWGPLIG